jgi:GNAT superfamily N-acetyltransferase
LRAVTARARDTGRIGPFLATFSRSSANPFLNYAIPEENAVPTADDVAGLVNAYRSRGLRPRLEYIPGIAPLVEDALLAQGFAVEERTPLMICPPGGVHDLPVPPGIEIVTPASDDELRAMLIAQNEAYGEEAPSEQDVARQRAFLADGGIARLARDAATGEPAGGGICTVPIDGITELAGVGVREPFRRRGIAAALTALLAQDALARGVTTVFLMAAHEAEARIYARVGFSPIGEVLHISQP